MAGGLEWTGETRKALDDSIFELDWVPVRQSGRGDDAMMRGDRHT